MNSYELAYKTADEIENRNAEYYVANMLRQQADRIAELQAKFKELAEATGFAGYLAGMMVFEDKTPQLKTLTDDEIAKVYIETQGLDLIENSPVQINMFTFARAILRKAQEK